MCSLLRVALCYLLCGSPQELGQPARRKQSGEVGTIYSMMLPKLACIQVRLARWISLSE